MPRTTLTTFAGFVALGLCLAVSAQVSPNPHLDPGLILTGCTACHEGHGVSRSPMLGGPQKGVCLACHSSQGAVDRLVAEDKLAATAHPALLGTVLAKPYTHPLSSQATSRSEPASVTCTSCHSPHRGRPLDQVTAAPSGRKRISPVDPTRFEYELCEGCHGRAGVTTGDLTDISRQLNPNNASYHPVEAPSVTPSGSVVPGLTGREINCTDCHGNDDPAGPRGPHGSLIAGLLGATYVTIDGSPESASTYALCYSCHERKAILERSPFPAHREHIVEARASCATCHNPHGSVSNRALIRFGEETYLSGVSPSGSGRLAFVSSSPGSGSCYLTCHGKDHNPLSYGATGPDGFAAGRPVDSARPLRSTIVGPVPERWEPRPSSGPLRPE